MKLGILISILILLDQIVKICITIINPQIITNSGWGLALEQSIKSEDNVSYIIISVIAIIVIIKYIVSKNPYIKNNSRVLLSFSVAGAIGNVIDRLVKGHVINYIQIPHFGAVNLSYIYIFVTWIGMAIIFTIFTIKKGKEKGKNNDKRDNSK